MSERGLQIKVGLLVLLALFILGGFLVLLGSFSTTSGFSFYVDFDFSGNLQDGAPVKVAGIKVGKVEEVRYLGGLKHPKTGRRTYVRVTAWVEDRVAGTVFDDAEFFVNTQGVLGEQYLEIVPGTPGRRPIRAGEVLVGVTPPRMDLVVARLYEVLDGVTRLLRDEKETIRNLLRSGTGALRTVDQLLSENRPEIKKLLTDADTLAGQAEGLLRDVRAGLGGPAQMRAIVGSLEKTSAALAQNLDGVLASARKALDGAVRLTGAVSDEDVKKIRAALDRMLLLSDGLGKLTGEARLVLAGLHQGKGTAGALLVKDELYDDLKEMVRDLRRNPWKFLWRE